MFPVQLNYNDDNQVVGGCIESHLLETSRISSQNPNETNFHIFQIIVHGLSFDLKQKIQLDDNTIFKVKKYKYLSWIYVIQICFFLFLHLII